MSSARDVGPLSLQASGRRDSGADRTADAGAAETAIAARVLRQILLVVVLGEIERRRVEDFGGDGVEAPRLEFLLVHRLRRLGGFALRRRGYIDAGAILRADVVALAHALRRVVVLPEGLEELIVGDLLRVIDHLHDLVVAGAAGADLLVGRIGRQAAGIAHGGRVNALAQLPELALGAPEAAHAEDRGLEAVRVRPLERRMQNKMLARGRNRRWAAGQRLGGRWHFELLLETEHGGNLRSADAHNISVARV